MDNVTKNFDFKVTDGEVTITKYRGTDTEVVIPPEIDGNPVTSIGMYAYANCTSLTNVTIPNSVTSIGFCAFDGCSSLTSIEIPESVKNIGKWAFANCTSLTSVTIGNSVKSIGRKSFCGCNSLEDIYYSGTKEQWGKIAIDSNNYELGKTTLHIKNA